jgi:hypothetical protein
MTIRILDLVASGRTVQGDYPGIEGNFSLRLGGMLRIWVWRRGTARSFIGILILPLMGAEILSIDALKGERWTPIWTLTKKRLQHQCCNLLILLERATGIEPATLGLGSLPKFFLSILFE